MEHDWLMVFDNASDDHGVSKYIPKGNRGNILFTSRNPMFAHFVRAENRIEVDDMEEEDAISLLLRSSQIEDGSTQARQAARLIVKELTCLPMAVDQAGAAIASGLCNLDDYLHRYHQHRQELLADATFKGASNYGRAVYATWDLSLSIIRSMDTREAESAISILRAFAYFHHEGITEDIIRRAAVALMKPTSVKTLTKTVSGPPSHSRWRKRWDSLKHRMLAVGKKTNVPTTHPLSSLDDLPLFLQLDPEGSWDPFFFRKGIHILRSSSLIKMGASNATYSIHL